MLLFRGRGFLYLMNLGSFVVRERSKFFNSCSLLSIKFTIPFPRRLIHIGNIEKIFNVSDKNHLNFRRISFIFILLHSLLSH